MLFVEIGRKQDRTVDVAERVAENEVFVLALLEKMCKSLDVAENGFVGKWTCVRVGGSVSRNLGGYKLFTRAESVVAGMHSTFWSEI